MSRILLAKNMFLRNLDYKTLIHVPNMTGPIPRSPTTVAVYRGHVRAQLQLSLTGAIYRGLFLTPHIPGFSVYILGSFFRVRV
jgi:hypothetical protein